MVEAYSCVHFVSGLNIYIKTCVYYLTLLFSRSDCQTHESRDHDQGRDIAQLLIHYRYLTLWCLTLVVSLQSCSLTSLPHSMYLHPKQNFRYTFTHTHTLAFLVLYLLTDTMLKSIMSGSGEHEIHTTKLLQIAQSLELFRVDDIPTKNGNIELSSEYSLYLLFLI